MAGLRLGVLISGRGTNLQALIDACAAPDYPAEIAVVVSNRPGAPGLERAAKADVPAVTLDDRRFESRNAFEHALTQELEAARVELVCLAGFMRLLSPSFVAAWEGRAINIHPSLLPAFKGLEAQDQAVAAGVRISGCTVHFVTAEMDAGPPIVQAAVPVHPDDGADELAARILEAEHRCYPWAVRLIAEGKVAWLAGRVVHADCEPATGVLMSPPEGLAPG
ncbi:MAG: phosphoribosylglycinamide formyltransferase [Alphaproteobacteria bacterium]